MRCDGIITSIPIAPTTTSCMNLSLSLSLSLGLGPQPHLHLGICSQSLVYCLILLTQQKRLPHSHTRTTMQPMLTNEYVDHLLRCQILVVVI